MPVASGSIAYLGAARFQGFWNGDTNRGLGANHPEGTITNAVTGTFTTLLTDGGYHSSTSLTAPSAGDYWQITGSGATSVDGETNWRLNDWLIYSGSAGATGTWQRLAFEDTIGSIILGDLTSSSFHMGSANDTHIIYAAGSVHTGSDDLVYIMQKATATIKALSDTIASNEYGTDGSMRFTLVSSDSTSVEYAIYKSGPQTTGGTGYGYTHIQLQGSNNVADITEHIANAITSANGHAGKLTATRSTVSKTNDTVTIEQVQPGTGGNTTIPAFTGGNASVLTINGVITSTSFSGGAGGKVGIGTASPDGSLHIIKASAGSVTVTGDQANGIIVEDDDSTAITLLDPAGGVIYFGDADDTGIGRIGYRHGGDYANSMYFWTNNAQQMTIDSAGKVGIGVADPDSLLEIFGTSTQLKLSYDGSNYSTFAAGATGGLTITTVDPDAAEADLTFTLDGAFDVNANQEVAIDSTAASITVGAALADGQTLKLGKNGAVETIIAPHGTAGSELYSVINTSGDTDGTDAAGAILLSSVAGGIGLAWAAAKDLWAQGGRFVVTAEEDAAECIKLHADAGASQTIQIINDAGTVDGTAGVGAIDVEATAGGISLLWNDAKDLWAEGGRAVITANEDAADCIKLHADAGTSQTITLVNDAGTNAAAIGLTATAGGVTIDAALDIVLSADGGNVTMDDGTSTIFDFNVDDTTLTIHDDQDTGDKFTITVAQHGATTIATTDDDSNDDADLTLDADGKIVVEAKAGDEVVFNDGAADIDFRVGTVDESHLIFVEGSTNRVSIGDNTGSPGGTLEVKNHASAGAFDVPLVQLNNNDIDQVALDINASNTTANVLDIASTALTTGKALNVAAATTTTTALGSVAFNLSFDKNAAAGSGVLQEQKAMVVALADSETNDAASTVKLTGLDMDVTSANTQGTLTNTGLDINVTGADTNYSAIFRNEAAYVGIGTTTPDHQLEIESSQPSEPVLSIKNTNHGATSGELRFSKDTNSGADNDVMGVISFYGTDAAENTEQKLAYIDAIITDSAEGSEAASLRFYVAENDGTNTLGLTLAGQADADGEVDVTIGAGAASLTTIAGDLDIPNGGFALGSDASGDMYYRDGSGVLTRIGVGSDNHVLTLNGVVPGWEAAAGGSSAADDISEGDAAVDIKTSSGNVVITGQNNGEGSINLHADAGANETISIHSDQGTGVNAKAGSTDASINLISDVGGIGLYSGINADDAITIEANGGANETIQIRSNQGTGVATAGIANVVNASIALVSDVGGVALGSAVNADNAIRLEADGGANETIVIHSNQGTGEDHQNASILLVSDAGGIGLTATGLTGVMTDGNSDAAVQLTALAGGIGLRTTSNLAAAIQIEADGGANETIIIKADQSTVDGAAAAGAIQLLSDAGGIGLSWADDKDLWAEGGRAVITANEDAADCIKLHADAGTSQTITIVNDAGTNAAAIGLTATAGGITLDAGLDIVLDADGDNIGMKFGGATGHLDFTNANSGDIVIQQKTDAKDIIFKQYDGYQCAMISDGPVGKGSFGYRKGVHSITSALDLSSWADAMPYMGNVIGVTMPRSAAGAYAITLPHPASAAEATEMHGWHVRILMTHYADMNGGGTDSASVTIARGDASGTPYSNADAFIGHVVSAAADSNAAAGITVTMTDITLDGTNGAPVVAAGDYVDILCIGASEDYVVWHAVGSAAT